MSEVALQHLQHRVISLHTNHQSNVRMNLVVLTDLKDQNCCTALLSLTNNTKICYKSMSINILHMSYVYHRWATFPHFIRRCLSQQAPPFDQKIPMFFQVNTLSLLAFKASSTFSCLPLPFPLPWTEARPREDLRLGCTKTTYHYGSRQERGLDARL